MVAPEGEDQFALVLRDVTRQRHGQVVAQGNLAAALVGELEQLLVGLAAALALDDLGVLEDGRIDRAVAVPAEDVLHGAHEFGTA